MPLVTVSRSLSRGEVVQPADLQLKMIQLKAYRRQGFTDIAQVSGAKMKKNIRSGEVIERRDICVVCKNETVIIKAVKGSMTITTKGTALTDGSSGDQVRVLNNKSKRIIEGIVSGMSEITVYF
jgi:flagella basal body P-ring formation protein FlgA